MKSSLAREMRDGVRNTRCRPDDTSEHLASPSIALVIAP
jgi:hypothetical protein